MSNSFLDSVVGAIEQVPDHIMTQEEKGYYAYLLSLMPIESEDIEALRESQVTLSSGLSNLHYILARRRAYYEAELAPRRVFAETEAEVGSDKRLTDKKRDSIVAADVNCKPWYDSVTIVEGLLDNIKLQLTTLEHRLRMLIEKSVSSRRMDDRTT